MTQWIVQAERRGEKNARQLRQAGAIPAVVYGHGVATEHLALSAQTFSKMYKDAGESTLLDLVVEKSEPKKVLIHDVQTDPLDGQFIHVDLYQVNMAERMKARVTLRFTGVAPVVKELGGVLVKNLTAINIECLPVHLVHQVDVDLSSLKEFGQSIYLRDLPLGEGITLLDRVDESVVTVMRPKSEEEVAAELAAEAPADVEQAVEVQKKGKEEEPGAEGDAAPTGEKSAKGGSPPKGGQAASGGKEDKGKKEGKKQGKKE